MVVDYNKQPCGSRAPWKDVELVEHQRYHQVNHHADLSGCGSEGTKWTLRKLRSFKVSREILGMSQQPLLCSSLWSAGGADQKN